MNNLRTKYTPGDEVIFLNKKAGYEDTRPDLHRGDKMAVLDCLKGYTYRCAMITGRTHRCGTIVTVYEDELDLASRYDYDDETGEMYLLITDGSDLVSEPKEEVKDFTPVKTAFPVNHTKEVTLAIEENPDIIAFTKACYNKAQKYNFIVGGLLIHMANTQEHIKHGFANDYKGFEAFVESVLDFRYGKARYLMNAYQKFTALDVPVERLEKIGWTKTRVITQVASKENFDELVDYAENHTREELEDHIKYRYHKTDVQGRPVIELSIEDAPKYTKMFRLIEEDSKMLDLALEIVRNNVEVGSDSDALSFIIRHFLTSNMARGVELEDSVRLLEQFYRVKLQVVK